MWRVLGCGGFFLCTLVLCLFLFQNKELRGFREVPHDIVLYEREDAGTEASIVEVVVTGVSEDMSWGVPLDGKNVLEIPSVGVRAGIYAGVGDDALLRGVGWHRSTVSVGSKGNAVLAGHSSEVYNCVLNGISGVNYGDIFWVWDEKGMQHEYRVVDKFVVSGGDVSILETERDDISMVTLYTCTEGGRERLVVVGLELDEEGYLLEMRSRGKYLVDRLKDLGESYRYENVLDLFKGRGVKLERSGVWYGLPYSGKGGDELCGRIEVW